MKFQLRLITFTIVSILLLSVVRAVMVGDGSIISTVEINSSTSNGPILNIVDFYGASITNIGDLNGDGVTDLVVSAYFDDEGGLNRGAAHIHFMNTDGSIDSTVEINSSTINGPILANNDRYGLSAASIGDLNEDGVTDLAVGAYLDDTGGTDRGTVHIHFMNIDGSINSTVEINSTTTNGPSLVNSDNYGTSVSSIGDLNGDGVTDLAVGAQGDDAGGGNRGAIHISFMNTDGTVDSTVEINSSTANGPSLMDNDNYGISVANIGDRNGDGITDLAVGAYQNDIGGSGRGAIYIHFMNTDGSVNSTVVINSTTTNGPVLNDGDSYGRSIGNIGDLNGDGITDLAVGAHNDDAGGTNRGTVHIHFMNTDGFVDYTVEINSTTTNGPTLADSDLYGTSIANIGDLDDNGVSDFAVGVTSSGANGGSLRIHFMSGELDLAPSISLNSLSPDPTNDNTPVFTGTASDTLGTVSNVEFQIDGTSGTWSACTADDGAFDELEEAFTCNVPTLSDSAHTIYVRTTDSYGVTTSPGSEATDTFTIDTVAAKPVVLTLGLIDNVVNADNVTYYFTSQTPVITGVAEPNSIVYFVFGDQVYSTITDTNGNFTITLNNPPLPRGEVTLTYYIIDAAGNKSAERKLTLIIGTEYFPEWLLIKLGLIGEAAVDEQAGEITPTPIVTEVGVTTRPTLLPETGDDDEVQTETSKPTTAKTLKNVVLFCCLPLGALAGGLVLLRKGTKDNE